MRAVGQSAFGCCVLHMHDLFALLKSDWQSKSPTGNILLHMCQHRLAKSQDIHAFFGLHKICWLSDYVRHAESGC